jgi:hypothetical protein
MVFVTSVTGTHRSASFARVAMGSHVIHHHEDIDRCDHFPIGEDPLDRVLDARKRRIALEVVDRHARGVFSKPFEACSPKQ